MKIVTFIAISAVIGPQVAATVPHRHGGQHEHARRDILIEILTEYTTVTSSPTDPAVVVWVENNGNIVSTETRADLGTSLTMAPQKIASNAVTTIPSALAPIFTAPPNTPAGIPIESSSSSVDPLPAPTTSTAPPAPAKVIASPTVSITSLASDHPAKIVPSASPTADSSKHGNDPGSFQGNPGLGIAYDLLDDTGACKSPETVESDFDNFASGDYSIVRTYNTDCNAVQLVTAQAAKHGMKVLAGIGNNHLKTDLVANIGLLITQAGDNLDVIDTIAIGNEYVGTSGGAVGDVVAAISAARTTLDGVFSGSIVTVDTFNTLISTPQLCNVSDYCAANCHAYFTDDISASGAGAYVHEQASNVAAANGGKKTVITESGWPWKSLDPSNTRASEANQDAAIASLRSAFSSNLFLFQAFGTKYKQTSDTSEWYYGIYYHDD